MGDSTTKTIKWGDKEVTPIATVADGAYWVQGDKGYTLLIQGDDGVMRVCPVIWGTALDILMRVVYVPEINVTFRRKGPEETTDAETTDG